MSRCDHDYVVKDKCYDCGSCVMRPTISSEQVFMANDVLIRKRAVNTTAKRFMRSSSAVKRAVKEVKSAKEDIQEKIKELEAIGSEEQAVMVKLMDARERLKHLSQLR